MSPAPEKAQQKEWKNTLNFYAHLDTRNGYVPKELNYCSVLGREFTNRCSQESLQGAQYSPSASDLDTLFGPPILLGFGFLKHLGLHLSLVFRLYCNPSGSPEQSSHIPKRAPGLWKVPRPMSEPHQEGRASWGEGRQQVQRRGWRENHLRSAGAHLGRKEPEEIAPTLSRQGLPASALLSPRAAQRRRVPVPTTVGMARTVAQPRATGSIEAGPLGLGRMSEPDTPA